MTIVKVVILGDSEVGKTSFTTRWTQGTFPDPSKLKTTVGASFDTKKVTLNNGADVTLSVWDFGGQKRFIETLKSMIRGTKVGVLFFDASHIASLDSIYNYWIPIVEEHGGFDFKAGDGNRFLLVANKIDLLRGSFDSVQHEMDVFSGRFGIPATMISAKTGIGIEQMDYMFNEILEKVIQ
jgi:small GTP-binding protein